MKIKIGFIGCGGIANAHMTSLAKIKEAEFAAFCDIAGEKAEQAAKTYGGKAYTDYWKMLDIERLDACYICVPPFGHNGQEELCIEKGIPFFVEKPVELNLKKAHAISKMVREKNLITSVGYILRYVDVVDKAGEFLKGREIAMVRGKYFGAVPGDGKGWYSQKKLSMGQLVEQATHTVDMMRYLAGDISEVFAYMFDGINNKLYEKYDVEDASVVAMKFKNGAIGSLACTWLWTGCGSGVEIFCKNLILTYEGMSLTVAEGNGTTTYTSTTDRGLAEHTAFVRAVRKNDRSLIRSNYEDGVKTLEVSLLAHASREKGVPVRISG